eukprot:IDg15282t1
MLISAVLLEAKSVPNILKSQLTAKGQSLISNVVELPARVSDPNWRSALYEGKMEASHMPPFCKCQGGYLSVSMIGIFEPCAYRVTST